MKNALIWKLQPKTPWQFALVPPLIVGVTWRGFFWTKFWQGVRSPWLKKPVYMYILYNFLVRSLLHVKMKKDKILWEMKQKAGNIDLMTGYW